MNEQWKIIDAYPNYSISSYGNVRNNRTGKLLQSTIFDKKYQFVTLWNNKAPKKIKISRLVAQAFIPNPNNLPCVNHKDENKLNNRVDNLEWCTYSYNINYGTANVRRANKLSKKVCKIDINNNQIICIYNSILEASQNNKNCQASNISKCCNHKYGFKTCGGYQWEYYKEV